MPYRLHNDNDEAPARTKLVIKFLEGKKKGLKMHFSIEQMPLLIGRHKSNHLVFEQD